MQSAVKSASLTNYVGFMQHVNFVEVDVKSY